MAQALVLYPLALYLSLCLLPAGRRAFAGIGIAALVLLALGQLWQPGGDAAAGRVLALAGGAGVGLAAIAQAVRLVLPPPPAAPAWAWPAVIGFVASGAVLLLILVA